MRRGLLRNDYFLSLENPDFDWIMRQIVNSINEEMLADLLLKNYGDNNLLIYNDIILKN
ncbi:hypothetical protein SAMN04488096_105157 [Mesonia phycicola]|uniref:Uncharacterized protein n=1 Tax=Mesonia phycicola TaxID=579105 RepID=A0A1M6EM85_9FLAO|nr:hypothetical protein [Mesonia phycicola]SHI86601.1 hypothetical protein SAMN04488096_105157 [Mesonia phycicola]